MYLYPTESIEGKIKNNIKILVCNQEKKQIHHSLM